MGRIKQWDEQCRDVKKHNIFRGLRVVSIQYLKQELAVILKKIYHIQIIKGLKFFSKDLNVYFLNS